MRISKFLFDSLFDFLDDVFPLTFIIISLILILIVIFFSIMQLILSIKQIFLSIKQFILSVKEFVVVYLDFRVNRRCVIIFSISVFSVNVSELLIKFVISVGVVGCHNTLSVVLLFIMKERLFSKDILLVFLIIRLMTVMLTEGIVRITNWVLRFLLIIVLIDFMYVLIDVCGSIIIYIFIT